MHYFFASTDDIIAIYGPNHVVYPPQIFKKKKKEFNKLLKEKERKKERKIERKK